MFVLLHYQHNLFKEFHQNPLITFNESSQQQQKHNLLCRGLKEDAAQHFIRGRFCSQIWERLVFTLYIGLDCETEKLMKYQQKVEGNKTINRPTTTPIMYVCILTKVNINQNEKNFLAILCGSALTCSGRCKVSVFQPKTNKGAS